MFFCVSKDSTTNRTNDFSYENIDFEDWALQNFSQGHSDQTPTVS